MFIVTMKALIFLLLLGMQGAAAVTHSLKYFYTASSQVPNFPEFVIVGLVDDVQMYYCENGKPVPKQDWLAKNTDQQYWERETGNCVGTQQVFKNNIQVAKERFNQTGGTHIFQYMYGCEWDDQNDETDGFRQYGYDGEDFIAWDMKTNTWVTTKQQAFMSTTRWNNNKAGLEARKNYLSEICIDWLKKYVTYGKSSLMRKVLPSVSLLQKSSSAPITCQATGFYPNRAEMVWTKNGEELHEGVVKGEILTNNDGTFQMSADLDLSAVGSADWKSYDCVFQLSGVNEDIVTKLDKDKIKTNEGSSFSMIILVVVAVVVLAVIAVIGFIIYKKRADKRPPSPVDNREVQEEMIPKA